jgi:hypothetical protein
MLDAYMFVEQEDVKDAVPSWSCCTLVVLLLLSCFSLVLIPRHLEAMVKRLMKEVARLQPASPLAHTPDLPEVSS